MLNSAIRRLGMCHVHSAMDGRSPVQGAAAAAAFAAKEAGLKFHQSQRSGFGGVTSYILRLSRLLGSNRKRTST